MARLYELALSEMITEMETLEVSGAMHWKDAVVKLVLNTANYYRTNKLTMILSLSPHSNLAITPINRAYAQALFITRPCKDLKEVLSHSLTVKLLLNS